MIGLFVIEHVVAIDLEQHDTCWPLESERPRIHARRQDQYLLRLIRSRTASSNPSSRNFVRIEKYGSGEVASRRGPVLAWPPASRIPLSSQLARKQIAEQRVGPFSVSSARPAAIHRAVDPTGDIGRGSSAFRC